MLADVAEWGGVEIDGLAPAGGLAGAGGIAAGRVDLGGAATGHEADVCVGADEDDVFDGGAVQREGVVGVLEQDDGFFSDVLCVVAAAEGIDDGAGHGGVVDDAGGEHAAEEAVDHVVEARLGDVAFLYGGLQVFGKVVDAGLFHVETGEGRLGGGVGGLPVRDDEAGVLPLALEDVGEEVLVFTRPVAVDLVVGAHDGAGVADADADLKGEQVGLVHGLVGHVDVDDGAAGLLVVEGVVLDVAHDVVGLDAHDDVADGGAGEDGIFAGVLKEAAVAWVAGEVDAAADGLVVTLRAELAADDVAVEVGGIGVPRCGCAEDGGQERGVAALGRGHADAHGGVCLLE